MKGVATGTSINMGSYLGLVAKIAMAIKKDKKEVHYPDPSMGPIRFVMASSKVTLLGISSVFKNPKILFTTLFISVLQIVLSYLKLLVPSSLAVTYASFFTFAQGGMYAGLIGAIGGIIGKGIYAWFINSLFFSKSNAKNKKKEDGIRLKTKRRFPIFLLGISMALLGYNFLTGNGSMENSVIGIIALASCVKAMRKKEGFLIGFISSFTKGKMTRNRAAIVIKGMALGFIIGVLSTLRFNGMFCYFLGIIMLVIALFLLLISRKRLVATVGALVLILGATFPAYCTAPPNSAQWITPEEAYGIEGDISEVATYMELKRAFEASPPSSMELTLVAIDGTLLDATIDEFYLLENQEILAENGSSDVFYIEKTFTGKNESISSSISLHLEEDGWYSDSTTSYWANNLWTEYETIEGTNKSRDKCTVSTFHLHNEYKKLFEPGLYIKITPSFSYGDLLQGIEPINAGPAIYLRVDRVKLVKDTTGGGSLGIWELKKTETYILRPDHNTSTKEKFLNNFNEEFIVDKYNISVSGNNIDFTKTRDLVVESGQKVQEKHEIRANFGEAPATMKAFETIKLSLREEGIYTDSYNVTHSMDGFSHAGFLRGLRPDSFSKLHSDQLAYAFGADIEETWFEYADGGLLSSAPQGERNGEILTLELVIGNPEPYDPTSLRLWIIPVIAHIYEWKSGALPPDDSEDGEDEYESSNGWWIGTDDDPDEHAGPIETGTIGIFSAIAGIAGAAAVAGGIGGGPGGQGAFPQGPNDGRGHGGYIKRDKDGDLLVRDPVTGKESIYVNNRETGLYTNPLTGATYTESELNNQIDSRAENAHVLSQDYKKSRQASEEQRKDNQNLSQGQNELYKDRQMINKRESLYKKGIEGDEIAAAMALKMDQMQKQKASTGAINKSDLARFQSTYSKWSGGTIADSSGLPKAENEWDIYKQGLANSGEEIARGESKKAIALRILVAALSGVSASQGLAYAAGAGKIAEAGFEIAQAHYVNKDYVARGGDDWKEAAKQGITNAIINEGVGRGVSFGIMGIGKGISGAANLASKTKVGKVFVGKAVSMGQATWRVLNSKVGDVPKVVKDIIKGASDSAIAAKVTKSAGSAAFKMKNPSKAIEKTGKKVAQMSDDLVKKPGTPPKTIKDSDAYRKASNEIDASIKKSQEAAAQKINKYKENVNKDPNLMSRKVAHEEGGKIGMKKVENLETAREAYNNNPNSPQVKKEFEQAVRDVQSNKNAQKIMNEKTFTGNETRQGFNDYKVKKDAVITMNTNERIATELGLDPNSISDVKASNTMDTSKVRDISGVAGESDLGTSKGEAPRKFTEADVDVGSLTKKGGDKISIDLDQTYRMEIKNKDGSVVYKDIPARKIKTIQNEEVYKAWNNGDLPLNPDGTVDHKIVEKFAEDMDYTLVDARSPDAYGTIGDLQQALKNDGSIRKYSDPEAVSKTISYKSDEWIGRSKNKLANGDIVGAEADIAEGIRQATKQYDSQLVYQAKAINTKAGAQKIIIPEKLQEGMEVLKHVGHGPGQISPAEAEAILKEMGTSTEKVINELSGQTEFINRLIAGGIK